MLDEITRALFSYLMGVKGASARGTGSARYMVRVTDTVSIILMITCLCSVLFSRPPGPQPASSHVFSPRYRRHPVMLDPIPTGTVEAAPSRLVDAKIDPGPIVFFLRYTWQREHVVIKGKERGAMLRKPQHSCYRPKC